ncbi:MAG: hypothetical protein ACR2PO_11490 [Methyloligellaceae bacterium]
MASTEALPIRSISPRTLVPAAVAGLLFIIGAAGALGPAWGYGLLLIATLFLLAGIAGLGFFVLTKTFDTDGLRRVMGAAFWLGGWCYVLGVAALSGYFLNETLHGRMELKWIIFGPAALAALVVLDIGLYRILVGRNMATWQRYSHVISRDKLDPEAMRRTLIDEVIIHRSLAKVSPFRWVRHQLILWGFALMFGVEIIAVFVREAFPAFGLRDIWEEESHPVRLAFDLAYDLTGLMILVGCLLALVFRALVNGKPDQKYADTPTALFLLIVVVSGFLIEGMRMAAAPGEAHHVASPVGAVFALAFPGLGSASGPVHDLLWLFHVLASCAFIAYVPIKRLVHSCATPLGRLMNSQKAMLAAKKEHVLQGLFFRKPDI